MRQWRQGLELRALSKVAPRLEVAMWRRIGLDRIWERDDLVRSWTSRRTRIRLLSVVRRPRCEQILREQIVGSPDGLSHAMTGKQI
jgi:hypothetical protein